MWFPGVSRKEGSICFWALASARPWSIQWALECLERRITDRCLMSGLVCDTWMSNKWCVAPRRRPSPPCRSDSDKNTAAVFQILCVKYRRFHRRCSATLRPVGATRLIAAFLSVRLWHLTEDDWLPQFCSQGLKKKKITFEIFVPSAFSECNYTHGTTVSLSFSNFKTLF